jgi:hypothetical protein
MKTVTFVFLGLVTAHFAARGEDAPRFDTTWIPARPEVLTYRLSTPQGEGMYQMSLTKVDSVMECSLSMVVPGFSKSVWGAMTLEMVPLRSGGRITVDGQVSMETVCSYDGHHLHIATAMKPYHQSVENDTSFSARVIDFSQMPLFLRALHLKRGLRLSFNSLNPRTNTLVPLTVDVVGEEKVKNIDCVVAMVKGFEGEWKYWLEEAGRHRVIRAEQPEMHYLMEIL